jgi:hypothetical protein
LTKEPHKHKSHLMIKKEVITDSFTKQEINLSSVTTSIEQKPVEVSKNKNKTKRSFFPKFNNEIILPGIAVGCILGVLLFYFQGLQPLILKNYADSASKQIVELKERYSTQIGSVSSTQIELDNYFIDFSDKVCSQQETYKTKKEDLEKIDRLKLSLVPDATYKNLANSGVFYNSEVQGVYQNFFTQYVNSLQEWSKLTTSLGSVPNFLDYRNAWVISCQKIESSQGNLADLKEACTSLITTSQTFENLKNTQFWEQVSSGVEQSLTKCNEVVTSTSRSRLLPNYGKWRLDWLTGYDRIVQARPVWDEINIDLNKTSENLLNSAGSNIAKINTIVEERRQFINLWYILEFR